MTGGRSEPGPGRAAPTATSREGYALGAFVRYWPQAGGQAGGTDARPAAGLGTDRRHPPGWRATASLTVAAGAAPKAVQTQLGHADVSTTLRICTHVTDAATLEAAATMDRLSAPSSRA